jgi:hypothetical protein
MNIDDKSIQNITKPEEKRTLGIRMCGWENDIKSDLKGTEREDVVWSHLALDSTL